MKNYVVQPGDTLSEIAEREYGDASLYPVIARQNHLANPDVIGVGQQLLIPYVTRRHHFTTADSTAARKSSPCTTTEPRKPDINGSGRSPAGWLSVRYILEPGYSFPISPMPDTTPW